MRGTPGVIRTHDLWLRKPTHYPAELRVLTLSNSYHRGRTCPNGATGVILAHCGWKCQADFYDTLQVCSPIQKVDTRKLTPVY